MGTRAAAARGAHSARVLGIVVGFGVLAGAWWVLVLVGASARGAELGASARYLAFPLALLLGLGIGRLGARRAGGGAGVLIPAAAASAALVLLLVPLYANAQAAAGVQLVALSGLMLRGVRARSRPPSSADGGAVPRPERVALLTLALCAVTVVLGVLLAVRSQAAAILLLPVAAAAVLPAVGAGRRTGSVRAVAVAGLGAIAAAIAAVLLLARAETWPRELRETESLSYARHSLWSDALLLWSAHPLTGAGPGAFYDYSATARSEEHLRAVHSSILQVGSEFGLLGALLLLVVLAAGVLLAARGDPGPALLGIAAWSALAVHSMIDHLYEFPVVVILAGLVVGWAGARPPRPTGPPIPTALPQAPSPAKSPSDACSGQQSHRGSRGGGQPLRGEFSERSRPRLSREVPPRS
ncbi:O-antigen ligase family protein [Brachybacterium aquaticum]|nr:O-antigen ligase family protein [Brachybacterium aquaticum]